MFLSYFLGRSILVYSIYDTTGGNTLFTGAKVIVSDQTGITSSECGGDHQLLEKREQQQSHQEGEQEGATKQSSCAGNTASSAMLAREDTQLLGKLRSKSGRSNIPANLRSTSMSCSDKIVKWGILGLQGSILTTYLKEEPILLSSIIVSQDPRGGKYNDSITRPEQLKALERAIPKRIKAVWDYVVKSTRKANISTKNNKDEEEAKIQQRRKIESVSDVCANKWKWCQRIPSVHIIPQVCPCAKSIKAPTAFSSSSVPSSHFQEEGKEPKVGDPSASQEQQQGIQLSTSNKKRKREGQGGGVSNMKKTSKISPCGVALSWQQPTFGGSSNKITSTLTSTEIIVGARGICQGKKPKAVEDYARLTSRLSRQALYRNQIRKTLHPQPYTNIPDRNVKSNAFTSPETEPTKSFSSYQQIKQAHANQEWKDLKRIVFQNESPLCGWLNEQNDFTI